ncbi:MAG: GNAT family N-acetyltransferase [Granulosicoccus sp.]
MATSPELIGGTLSLKPFSEHHVSENYVSWLNDKATMAFSEQRHRVHTLDSCRLFYMSFEGGPNQLWAIEISTTGEHIGNITVSHDINNRLADIGILIGANATRGRGYGRSAWSMVLEYLKTRSDIYKITGGCMKSNLAMARIMESCGMTLDCVRSNHFLLDNSPEDIVFYSLPGVWNPSL